MHASTNAPQIYKLSLDLNSGSSYNYKDYKNANFKDSSALIAEHDVYQFSELNSVLNVVVKGCFSRSITFHDESQQIKRQRLFPDP